MKNEIRVIDNHSESRFVFLANLFTKFVFGFTAAAIFYISISGLISGLPLVPSLGLFIFGMVFVVVSLSSKEILERVLANS